MSAAYIADRIAEDGDCQRWTGWCVNGHPAGRIDGKHTLIRRWLYEQANGPIPKGRVVRCNCETPLCVNLEHSALSTYRAIALHLGALGVMSGPVRSARIAAAKRAGAQAKISQTDAAAIRVSDESGVALATRYGISQSTVSKIKRGVVRRDFAGDFWAGLRVAA